MATGSLVKKWAWFAGLWLASTGMLGAVAYLIRLVLLG